MGTITRGILGGFEGKVGTVVGSNWRGVETMRAKPRFKRNRKFSDKQLRQQERFGLITTMLTKTRSFVEIGFRTYGNRQTGYNEALAYNIQRGITGTYPDLQIDYPNVMMSRGNLDGVEDCVLIGSNLAEWTFTWRNNSDPDDELAASASDDFMVCCWCPSKGKAFQRLSAAERGAGTYTINFPDNFSGVEAHVWVAFKSNISQKVSDSVYMGAQIIP